MYYRRSTRSSLPQAAATAQLIAADRGAGRDAAAVVGSSKEYLPIRWLFYVAIGLIRVITLAYWFALFAIAAALRGRQ